MTRFRPTLVAAAVVSLAGCEGVTEPPLPELAATWIEWPAVVSADQPGGLRISAQRQCPVFPLVSLEVSARRIVVQVASERRNVPCLHDGSGAGADFVLPLPELDREPGAAATEYEVWAPMAGVTFAGSPGMRRLGTLQVGAIAGTAWNVAGNIRLSADGACWLARPFSQAPIPRLEFTEAPPLVFDGSQRLGFVIGNLVELVQPSCGDGQAINASTLEVEVS